MTDHAPSVVTPATLREALERAAANNHEEGAHGRWGGPATFRECADPYCIEAQAALRAEPVAVAPEPEWPSDADRLAAFVRHHEAEVELLRAALHAPPALDAAPDLPARVVVGKNGAYWRDYGDHYSMCPVSEDNDPVEVAAVYVRSRITEAEEWVRSVAAAIPASGEPAPAGYYEVLHAKSRNVVADFPTEDEARSYAALDSELTYRYRLNGSPAAGAEEPPR